MLGYTSVATPGGRIVKFLSESMTTASGSVGGTTYSRNRYGMYRRSRATPVNPNTANQVLVRAAMTGLVNAWTSVLTGAQRDVWNDYAANVPVTDALGQSINLTGQNWYIGNNVPRLQASIKLSATVPSVAAGPTIFNRGDFTTPTFAASESTGFSVTFDDSDDWANEDNAFLFLYQGKPVNASRNFFNGPYRLVGVIEGDAVSAPSSPATINAATLASLGFAIAEDQLCNLAVSVARADGRLSTRRLLDPQVCTS